MITVENLHYHYPKAPEDTLHGISFEVLDQEIFGFLGPSGAGKSTTQKILIALLDGYRGSAKVMGRDIKNWGSEYFENVGVSFELPNHYQRLSALENLQHFGALYRGKTLDPLEVLSWVDLQDHAKKRVSDFSKGMKIRLNVARSLLHKPKILFLDEPTSGLDPVNAKRVKDLVRRVRDEGTTVFITTHNMAVADELCDRVAFISGGRIASIDSPSALKSKFGQRRVVIEYNEEKGAGPVKQAEFPLDGLGANREFSAILNSGHYLRTLHTQETTLENVFIEVTGEALVQ